MKTQLKQEIIEAYIKSPHTNYTDIAVMVGSNKAYTSTVINQYKQEITLKLPLYCVKSMDLKDVFYLFTEDGEEKMIKVKDRIVVDVSELTDYEMTWLHLNRGFN